MSHRYPHRYSKDSTSPTWNQLVWLRKHKWMDLHNIPSWPGCRPIRSILRISSRVTSSLLNNPPWTTKNRLRPCGERIASPFCWGGFVALRSVANGTSHTSVRQGEPLVRNNLTHRWWKHGQRADKNISNHGLGSCWACWTYLVGLIAMFMLGFAFKSICTIHVFSLMISTIDIHVFRI